VLKRLKNNSIKLNPDRIQFCENEMNLTDSLKDKGKDWKWTDEMNREFLNMKNILSELGNYKVLMMRSIFY
jgi:hypothetical protein